MAYSPFCSYQHYLLGIDADTGTTKFKVTLGSSSPTNPSNRNGYVAAHDNGLIVRHGDETFRYFNYSGVEDTNKQHTISLSSGEYVGRWGVNTDGTLFVMVGHTNWSRPEPCTKSNILNRVFRRTLAGNNYDYELDDACTSADIIQVTPTGGAVVPIPAGNQVGGSYDPDTSLLLLQSNGNIVGITVPPPAGFTLMTGGSATTPLLVDTAGNLVLTRRLYDIGSTDGDRYVQVALLNPGGALMASYNTFVLGNPSGWNNHRAAEGGTGIVNGSIYLAYCLYTTCNFAGAYELHKLSFAEVGFEYPRGALLDLPAPQPTLDLVVMGDSYSSGEGVSPFESGTDIDNVNECHRSDKAYARLLDQDPSVPLYLQAFPACSGAQSFNITTTGQWNEDEQVVALNASTDVVTLSIGGNDIGFERFVTQCLFVDCSETTVNEEFFDAVDGLGTALDSVYDQVLSEAENADVYVVGYPHLLPDAECNQTDAWMVAIDNLVELAHEAWLDPEHATSEELAAVETLYLIGTWAGLNLDLVDDLIEAGEFEFSLDEIQTARDLVTELNQKIDDNVPAQPSRLHYVDPTATGSPFIGHELCTSESYFNGLVPLDKEHSFHPNALGQAAFALLIGSELT